MLVAPMPGEKYVMLFETTPWFTGVRSPPSKIFWENGWPTANVATEPLLKEALPMIEMPLSEPEPKSVYPWTPNPY